MTGNDLAGKPWQNVKSVCLYYMYSWLLRACPLIKLTILFTETAFCILRKHFIYTVFKGQRGRPLLQTICSTCKWSARKYMFFHSQMPIICQKLNDKTWSFLNDKLPRWIAYFYLWEYLKIFFFRHKLSKT